MAHYFDWNSERDAAGTGELLNRAPRNTDIDLRAVRAYRQNRLRYEMARHGMDAVILCDAVNIKYATGTQKMQIWDIEDAVDEVRIAKAAQFNLSTSIEQTEREWSVEMGELIKELVGHNKAVTVGLECINAGVGIAIKELDFIIVDAQKAVELTKFAKCEGEVKCIKESLRATERGVHILGTAVRPGLTENELGSILHKAVIERDGDYCETRLLNSGKRSVPLFQETSNPVIDLLGSCTVTFAGIQSILGDDPVS
ncbi:hypothetical protein diail_842 [Diaporthe ilicicola]|nr:hypothetical protein diail_842 [Diaporthe ilicicola]